MTRPLSAPWLLRFSPDILEVRMLAQVTAGDSPTLEWRTPRIPDGLLLNAAEVHDTSMALTRQWKYAVDAQGRGYMLFDVQNDPNEMSNLIGAPEAAQAEREMRDRLLNFYTSTQVKQ